MKKTPSKTIRFRFIKAYSTGLRIMLSYGWLYFTRRFVSNERHLQKMALAHLRNALRLKNMILELRGLYIKVGQLISIMSNFLPEKFRHELKTLQDKIPPRSYNEIAARIRTELGNSPESFFKSFDKEPIASASLAQVHIAELHNGQKVAVKVQYMDIEQMARIDLKTLQRILGLVQFFFRIKGISTNFQQIREMILDELDFRKEAQYIDLIASNFIDDTHIKFPSVFRELSTQRVLTTQFMKGIKVTNFEELEKQEINREKLANRIISAYCKMIFTDGIYHADPHPGNILVEKDGSVIFIDFGAVARLSNEMKEGIPQFFEGVIKRDKEKITDALTLMGFIAPSNNGYDIEKLIEYFYATFLQEMSFDSWSLKDIEKSIQSPMEVFGDFRKLNISFREIMANVQVPKDWVLLERTIMLLMGLCTELHPQINPMKTIKPYLENFVFGAGKDWKSFIGNIIKDTFVSVLKLPDEINRFLSKADKGELQVRVRDISEGTEILYALGHQVLYGLFSMVTGGLAYFAHLNNEIALMKWLIGISGFFGVCLFGSMWKVRNKRKKRKH